ncbi:MAG: arylamine N-acetyltransferase [Lachnospiraceae bacterium]|nr:arylamine N-acetyltransferase [Lachnospiraceae bacterium]
MLNEIQVKQYLQRIEYNNELFADLATLIGLQWAHMTHIPYENLDILSGIPLSLKTEDLFRKIVTEKRGGYCFELQGLYGELLKSCGFDVVQYAARFMDEEGIVQMRRHRILVVRIGDERYLTDVGVRSESPRIPLKLVCDELQTDNICEYKFQRDPFYGWVLYQKERGKQWKTIYGFTEEPQIDDDFVMPSFYCEKHPDSTFNKFMKISIFRGESNFTLVNGIFREYRNAKVHIKKELTNNAETSEILKKYFGLNLYSHNTTNSESDFESAVKNESVANN